MTPDISDNILSLTEACKHNTGTVNSMNTMPSAFKNMLDQHELLLEQMTLR